MYRLLLSTCLIALTLTGCSPSSQPDNKALAVTAPLRQSLVAQTITVGDIALTFNPVNHGKAITITPDYVGDQPWPASIWLIGPIEGQTLDTQHTVPARYQAEIIYPDPADDQTFHLQYTIDNNLYDNPPKPLTQLTVSDCTTQFWRLESPEMRQQMTLTLPTSENELVEKQAFELAGFPVTFTQVDYDKDAATITLSFETLTNEQGQYLSYFAIKDLETQAITGNASLLTLTLPTTMIQDNQVTLDIISFKIYQQGPWIYQFE